MLDQIKNSVFQYFKADSVQGLFLTAFDTNGGLFRSDGVLETDKTIDQLIDLLYHGLFEKNSDIKTVLVDVVTEVQEEKDMQKLMQISPKEYGFSLVSTDDASKSGVLLPDTKGVESVPQALQLIKQKYALTGSVNIFVFKTQKIVVAVA